jgi:hypothetical protein
VTVHILEPGFFKTNIIDEAVIFKAIDGSFNKLSKEMKDCYFVLRFTSYNYPSGIFKFFLQKYIYLALVDITAGRLFTHQDIASTAFRTSVLTDFQTFYLRNFCMKN